MRGEGKGRQLYTPSDRVENCENVDYKFDMRHIQYQGETLPLVLAFHLVLGKYHI